MLPIWEHVECPQQSTEPQNFVVRQPNASVNWFDLYTFSGLQVTLAGYLQFSSSFDTQFRVSTCTEDDSDGPFFETILRIFDSPPLSTYGVALNIGDESAVNTDWRDALTTNDTNDPVLEFSLCGRPNSSHPGRAAYLEFNVSAFDSVYMVLTGQDGIMADGDYSLNVWCSGEFSSVSFGVICIYGGV